MERLTIIFAIVTFGCAVDAANVYGPFYPSRRTTTTAETTRRVPDYKASDYQLWGHPTPKTPTKPKEKYENVTLFKCYTEEKYRRLKSCQYALKSKEFRDRKGFTDKYLCREKRAKEQNAPSHFVSVARPGVGGNRAFHLNIRPAPLRAGSQASSSPVFRNQQRAGQGTQSGAFSQNPCSTTGIAQSNELIHVEDMFGKEVELYNDINEEIFQTVYKKDCVPSNLIQSYQQLYGLTCSEIYVEIETAVWRDDNDFNVDIKKVRIAIDCAFHTM